MNKLQAVTSAQATIATKNSNPAAYGTTVQQHSELQQPQHPNKQHGSLASGTMDSRAMEQHSNQTAKERQVAVVINNGTTTQRTENNDGVVRRYISLQHMRQQPGNMAAGSPAPQQRNKNQERDGLSISTTIKDQLQLCTAMTWSDTETWRRGTT
jgi:hypothetical protein